jgi:hypothetical protein
LNAYTMRNEQQTGSPNKHWRPKALIKRKNKRTSGLLADVGVENRSFAHVSGVWAMTARERNVGNETEETKPCGSSKDQQRSRPRESGHTHTHAHSAAAKQAQALRALGFISNENHPQFVIHPGL